jgi:hypothetical protein
MNYTRVDSASVGYTESHTAQPRNAILLRLERMGRVALWAIVNTALLFAEHAAELAAPFLIIGGAVWWAIPQALSAITLDGPANDMLQVVRARVPHEILLGGNYVSASSLITDGILCIAVVAICRTVTTMITALLLDRSATG